MSLALAHRVSHRPLTRSLRHSPARRRLYSTENAPGKQRSPHAAWYAEMLPGMVPIALLGSAVYVGLRFVQASLVHERWLDETRARVQELEREVEALREQRARADASPTAAPAVVVEGKAKSRGWLW